MIAPTVARHEPRPKYKTLEERFLAYSLNGQQRQGKVITEATDSGQFNRMTQLIKQGR